MKIAILSGKRGIAVGWGKAREHNKTGEPHSPSLLQSVS